MRTSSMIAPYMRLMRFCRVLRAKLAGQGRLRDHLRPEPQPALIDGREVPLRAYVFEAAAIATL